MVYCTKCGTKNDDNAEFCVKCSQPLNRYPSVRHERRRKENECFGLPHGGAIAGLVIGFLIILWGVTSVLHLSFELWPIVIIIFGVLMAVGALYSMTRRR